MLVRVIVIATGAGAGTFYDNASAASGNKLLVIPANAAVGTIYTVEAPAANGIYYDGITNSPGVTVTWW
jgi:hypothetical protein